MTFELVCYPGFASDGSDRWTWELSAADGKVATSAGTFPNEAAVRSDVARAKKKMSGAKFAKVEVRP